MRVAVAVAAVCAAAHCELVDVRELDVDDCLALAGPPRPQALEFCYDHNSKACCVPGADQESHVMFARLMDVGLACSYAQTGVMHLYEELRSWYCLACDPNEPRYRFRTAIGDSVNYIRGVQSSSVWTWRVCRSFLDKMWHGVGQTGKDGGRYDMCGVKTENPCAGNTQVVWSTALNRTVSSEQPVLGGWDPYQCGDNFVVPSKFYQGQWEAAASAFLRDIPPPNFDDAGFRFVVVDDSKDTSFSWEATPCFAAAERHAPAALLLSLAAVLTL
eukprot:TRINITY_DN4587_c3_g1_i1.p2 TRINITY_DN4587_c3_g1~~TRINITY_DN4587_c3_g1_i1.p2  ORF type:complete len:273 (+),score=89.74 TRINITY_DN4587_c3_g1_i1:44-862(+)